MEQPDQSRDVKTKKENRKKNYNNQRTDIESTAVLNI